MSLHRFIIDKGLSEEQAKVLTTNLERLFGKELLAQAFTPLVNEDGDNETMANSNTLAAASKTISVAEIVHHGEKLVLPEGMGLDNAIELIKRRMVYEQQETRVVETFDCFPYDGAVMLDRVLQRRYGWSPAVPTPGFFSDNPPVLISVEVAPGEYKQVPWGRFLLPNVSGHIDTGVGKKDGRICFSISATVLRLSEPIVRSLFEELRAEIQSDSIYRGKAVAIEFTDADGDPIELPTPKFMDTARVDRKMLILSRDLEESVQTNLFTPITRCQDCLDNGIPVKRGVLLGGTFGTGKTLIASVASALAVEHGITYLYIKKAKELPMAINFAKQYQSPACAIFCEDIDREMDGERDADMDSVLNTIDGIDSKNTNVIVVLTTNNIGSIHPAMLRPGRLDAVIDVTPPDAEAIERLVKAYAYGALEPDIDLREVGEVLAGNIPAVIAEVVKRAKLSQLSLQPRGTKVTHLTAAALLDSARTMQAQVELLKPRAELVEPTIDAAIRGLVRGAISQELPRKDIDSEHARVTRDNVDAIRRRIG